MFVLTKHMIAHLPHSTLTLNQHFQFISLFTSNHNLNLAFRFLNQLPLYQNLHFSLAKN